jgi:hypothetical protein
VVNFPQRRQAQNQGVGVKTGLAALTVALWVLPLGKNVLTEPDGSTSSLPQSCVIIFPVAEPVGGFGFLVFS